MNTTLLLITSLIYAWVAVGFVRENRWSMAFVFAAYALANVGLALDAKQPMPFVPPK